MRPRLFLKQVRAAFGILQQPSHGEFRTIFLSGAMGSGTSLCGTLLYQEYVTALLTETPLHHEGSSPLSTKRVDSFSSVKSFLDSMPIRDTSDPLTLQEHLRWFYERNLFGSASTIIDHGPTSHLARIKQLADSFPSAGFCIVIREPVALIEGLRRKWALFANESVESAILFLKNIQDPLLESYDLIRGRTIVIRYDDIISDKQSFLQKAGIKFDLTRRNTQKRIASKDNLVRVSEKGLRNIEAGLVRIDRRSNERSIARMSPKEKEIIERELGAQWELLSTIAMDLTVQK